MASSVFFRLFGDFIFISEENEIFHGKFVMVKTHLRCKYTYISNSIRKFPITLSLLLSLALRRSIYYVTYEHQFFSHLRVFITSTTAGIFEGRHDISLAQLMDFIDFITSSLLLLITLQRKTQSITLLMDACLLAQHKMGKCW